VQPVLFERLKILPQGPPYTSDNMDMWVAGFIQRFGTHFITGSLHGASLKTLASSNERSEQDKSCMSAGLCFQFQALEYASVALCANSSGCDARNTSESFESSTCEAVGGDLTLDPRMCSSNVEQAQFDQWMIGGDPTSGSSAYQYDFKPIADFLTDLDFAAYYNTSKTLEKAVEYHNCRTNLNPPVEQWDEDEGCQCVRPCANGGTLDKSSCTCKCRGDIFQGWTGPNCETTYGSCQPGPGTGNPAASDRCRVTGTCSSNFDSDKCKVTEICCATNFNTRCCPFGNSCKCSADNCTCVSD